MQSKGRTMSGATPKSALGPGDGREDGLKHGLTLGEWLNQSILAHEEAARVADAPIPPNPEIEARGPDGGWALGAGDGAENGRVKDALERLAQRIEASERRQALSMTGLDRTVLGLAARVEDAEAHVRSAASKVTGAVEEMRRTGDVIVDRVQQAETITRETAGEVTATLQQLNSAREAIAARLKEAEGGARRTAEHVASEVRAELSGRIDVAEAFSREVAAAAAAEIRAAQDALAERMQELEHETRTAALDAVRALRAEQEMIEARIAAAEMGSREAAADALRELHATQAAMHDRLRDVEAETRRATSEALAEIRATQDSIAERIAASGLSEQAREALAEVENTQRALAHRFDGLEHLTRQTADAAAHEVAEGQRAIEQRLEQIEHAARESAANLRMGAAAAINQVRAAQLELEKRVKLVEAGAVFSGGGVDGERLRETHAALEERLERIERGGGAGGQDRAALHMLDAKITGLAATVRDSRDRTAMEIEQMRSKLDATGAAVHAERLTAVERSVEDAIARLADRLVQAENTANDALRRLETATGGAGETDTLRTMVEQRLETMAATMTEMVGGVRAEIESKVASAGDGGDVEAALADVNRRVAASERRQAQTIEAISIEIRRMSESIDRRLRTLETRNDPGGAADAVREEVAKLTAAFEDRLSGVENREIASVERVGVEMGRLAERFDERFDGVERRSAEAIEHVGEQVARVAERLALRQDQVARELTERIVESEERTTSRLTDTIATVASRLQAVEERATTTLSPVQKAMTSLASRLQALEDGSRGALTSFDAPPRADALPPAGMDLVDDSADDDAAFVQGVDLGDIDELVERISGRLTPETPAFETVPEIEVIETNSGAGTTERDPFDQLLPEDPSPPAPAPVPAPEVTTDANSFEADTFDFEFDEDEPPTTVTARTAATQTPDDLVFEEPEAAETPKPVGKQDYLANARRAAQASAQPGRRRGGEERGPVQGLRGPNRVLLWSAAGALAVALAGGAYLVKVRSNSEDAKSEPQPDTSALTPPEVEIPAAAPLDPALTPVDGALLEPLPSADPELTDSSIAAAAAKANAESRARPERPAKAEPERTRPGARTSGPQASAAATLQPAALSGPGARSGVSLEAAALRGDAVAQYELGLQRLASGQTPEGVALLRRAANQGLAMAQYRLAKLFERGEGVPADLVQARQWTERAAAAGNRKAMHDLGVYYARGEGAPLDEAAAYRWFRQAAELGVADSQFNLGVLYQQGRGTPANTAEALYWFSVAARAGDSDARGRAAMLEAQLGAEAATTARSRAAGFSPKPASARANGEFGQRVWGVDSAQASAPPRS
jgi:localization factor PodJL